MNNAIKIWMIFMAGVNSLIFWLADMLDEFRIFPRLFIIVGGYGAWMIGRWFMGLDSPSAQQSAFAIAVIGGMMKLFEYYVQSGNRKND